VKLKDILKWISSPQLRTIHLTRVQANEDIHPDAYSNTHFLCKSVNFNGGIQADDLVNALSWFPDIEISL
jgi:hypothetical protein